VIFSASPNSAALAKVEAISKETALRIPIRANFMNVLFGLVERDE
jgi:hypothetical protein